MIQYLNIFFYDICPYLYGMVFILGGWLCYDYGQYTQRAAFSQMLDRRGMVIWSNLFHVDTLGVFFGHSFDMLTPHWMYAWFLPMVVKQQMAMIPDGIYRVLTLADGVGLLVHRLTNPRIRVASSGADILILAILLTQCILGLTTIPFLVQYPGGSEMMKPVGRAQSIVTFQGGASTYFDGAISIFRVHLVLGMTILLFFLFT